MSPGLETWKINLAKIPKWKSAGPESEKYLEGRRSRGCLSALPLGNATAECCLRYRGWSGLAYRTPGRRPAGLLGYGLDDAVHVGDAMTTWRISALIEEKALAISHSTAFVTAILNHMCPTMVWQRE